MSLWGFRKKALGLSYSDSGMRGVLVQPSRGGIKILRCFHVKPDENGAFPLEETVRKEGAKGVPCHLVVPRFKSAVRYLDLPPLKGQDLHGALQYEASRHFPYDLSNAYWDGQPCSEDEESRRVAICAVKKGFLDELLARWPSVGSRVETVTVASFALHASYVWLRKKEGWQSALVVDVSPSGLSMAICLGDELVWCRGVDRPVHRGQEGSWDADEILRSLETAEKVQNFPPPEQILLCGDPELVEKAESALRKEAELSLGLLNPLIGATSVGPVEPSEATAYGVAMGAALAAEKNKGLPINIMPRPEPVTLKSALTPDNMVQVGYLAAFFFLLIVVSLIVNISFRDKRLTEVNKELTKLRPLAEEARTLRKEVMDLQQESEAVREKEEEWTSWLDILAELYMIVPDEAVTVERIELVGDKLDELSCRATSATGLMTILEDSLYFEEVVPKGRITTDDDGLERFSLAAKLTRKEL